MKPTVHESDLVLVRRSELLGAVVAAAELLLGAAKREDVAEEVLCIIGQVMRADRCCLGQCSPADKYSAMGYLTFIHEWTAEGIARQTDDPALRTFNMDHYQEFMRPLLRGEPIGIKTPDIADGRARTEQEATGSQSQFVFPITVDGVLWGCLCADDCRTPREWSVEEVATLRVVSSALASVVKREMLMEQRLAAERQRAEELATAEVKARHEHEKMLLKERARFAGQIHDTLAQGFTGVLLHLEALRVRASRGARVGADELQVVRTIAALGLAEARRSALALRPLALDGRGLAGALQQLAERSCVPELLACRWELHGVPRGLPVPVEEALLNIAHEAVSNAIRHAEAHTVAITLSFEAQRVELNVRDDGLGFDASEAKRRGHTLGLGSMQERAAAMAGECVVTSQLGQGTTVRVRVGKL
jgi:signal transduction histidine kinase